MKKTVIPLIILFCAFTLGAWFKPHTEFSQSERRVLATPPELSLETLADSSFMADFETYAAEQFPLRDALRTVKAATALGVFQKSDNNGIFFKDNHISKLEYPLNPKMLAHAAERFNAIYDAQLKDTDCKVYFSAVPDKNFYMQGDILKLDYMELFNYFKENLPNFEYIDITSTLGIANYYRTDSHWRQEALGLTVKALTQAMGADAAASYDTAIANGNFKGVYAAQSALPVKGEALAYLTNEILEACTLTSYDSGKPQEIPIYDMDAAAGRDGYEMFMGGADALLVLESPKAKSDKELIIFRDSYAASIAPLLAPAYKRITLVDTRYVNPAMLGNFVKFSNQDVLFLYSTSILNNSLALK